MINSEDKYIDIKLLDDTMSSNCFTTLDNPDGFYKDLDENGDRIYRREVNLSFSLYQGLNGLACETELESFFIKFSVPMKENGTPDYDGLVKVVWQTKAQRDAEVYLYEANF